jgi:hypothetical protein
MHSTVDIFDQLRKHFDKDPALRAKLAMFRFWHIPEDGVACEIDFATFRLPSVLRKVVNVTGIPGIRCHFCFRIVLPDQIYYREMSCHCHHCLDQSWDACENTEAGPWKKIQSTQGSVQEVAAASRVSRGTRDETLRVRVSEARQAKVGDICAFESEKDAEGFNFWIAKVCKVAWQQQKAGRAADGEVLKRTVFYLEVQYLDRAPISSTTKFKLNPEVYTVRATGMVKRNIPHSVPRSGKAGKSKPAVIKQVILDSDVAQEVSDQVAREQV